MLDAQQKQLEANEQVQFISEQGANSCDKCKANNKKTFYKNDPNKPIIPIHPNCKCKYIDIANDNKTYNYARLKVKNAPGILGYEINSREEMVKFLEKQYKKNSLNEIIIVNHGDSTITGEFELGSKKERFDRLTQEQINRLKNLLAPNAIIDLRMCYQVADEKGEQVAQELANKLNCRIKAYGGQVSPFGTRGFFLRFMLMNQNYFILKNSLLFE